LRFSIIIPTYNRPLDLARSLSALACLDYPAGEFEVIVVDDGGGANLEPLLRQHRPLLRLTLLRQPNSGPAAARNNGAAHASGQFLAFFDDDCVPLEGWLRALDDAVTLAPRALIGGRVQNGVPDRCYAAASQRIIDFLHQHFNCDPENGRFFPSNNIAVSADLFRQVGGFDAAFQRSASEDRDFCDRWLTMGWKLVAAWDAVVIHHRDMSFHGFWRQQHSYGRGAHTYAEARRRRNGGPVPFEGWRFHVGMILAPLRDEVGPRSLYLSFLIVVSQIAVVAGYFAEARAQNRNPLPAEQTAKPLTVQDSASLRR
jgi:GT2 family glycosyltransferase